MSVSLESLVKKILASQSIYDAADHIEAYLGPQVVQYIAYGLTAAGALLVLYVVKGLLSLLSTPTGSSNTVEAKSAGKKKHSSAEKKRTMTPPPAPQATAQPRGTIAGAAPPATTVELSMSKRSRTPTVAEPTSTLRGFPRLGVLATSPCQSYFVVSCRKTCKARVYPQNSKRAFMEKGKELQDHYFMPLDKVIQEVLEQPTLRVDISAVGFSADGLFFAVGESATDTIFVLTTDGKKSLHVQHSSRLCDRRLVSALGTAWSLAGDAGEYLVVSHDKEAEVELLYLLGKAPANNKTHHSVVSSTQKFKIGHALSWSLAGLRVAVSGSFMKEARTAGLHLRHDQMDFTLAASYHTEVFHDEAATGGHAALKVQAVALVTKGAPRFNTREYFVVFLQDGRGFVYDVSGDETPEMVLRGTFVDTDYARSDDRVGQFSGQGCTSSLLGMAVSVSGESYHERIRIALWNHQDVSVHVQTTDFDFKNKKPFALKQVLDIHDAHGALSPLKTLTFVQNGEGIATAGSDDDHHVRLWSLPVV